MMPSMAGVLVSKFPSMKEKKPKADDVDVDIHVYSKSPDEDKMHKEEYKRLNAERKRLKLILENWNPDLISTKARAKTEMEMRRVTMHLRELRKEL